MNGKKSLVLNKTHYSNSSDCALTYEKASLFFNTFFDSYCYIKLIALYFIKSRDSLCCCTDSLNTLLTCNY